MAVDDAPWGEIRACYGDASLSVAKLAERFGVSVGAIRYRARRDGWPKRRRCAVAAKARREKQNHQVAVVSTGDERRGDGKQQEKRNSIRRETEHVSREDVVARLYRAIVRKLTRLEKRMEGDGDVSPADSERETRELSSMVRSFEKITDVGADLAKERKPKGRQRGRDANDAERMRVEIAQRLERLGAQRDA